MKFKKLTACSNKILLPLIIGIFLIFSLPAQASSGIPTRIKIPKIKVDVALESVGLNPDGVLGVAKSFGNAAWYNLGVRPGDNGSAVINGHYGYLKNGKIGVFTNLNKLRKGDKIYIKDDTGSTTTFIVREIRKYDLKANATEVFYANDNNSHLNIVTCEGIWNKITKSYSGRLVVFADKK